MVEGLGGQWRETKMENELFIGILTNLMVLDSSYSSGLGCVKRDPGMTSAVRFRNSGLSRLFLQGR